MTSAALRQAVCQHLVRLAESRLRECEDAFTEHLADDPLPYLAEIAKAEQHVAQARACLAAADALQRAQAKQAAASAKHLEKALACFEQATALVADDGETDSRFMA